MKCPACGAKVGSGGPVKVIDSRIVREEIRRRRACSCGHRFTTYERIVADKDDKELERAMAHALPKLTL
jgi:transcriptional regulator NrdR family protein